MSADRAPAKQAVSTSSERERALLLEGASALGVSLTAHHLAGLQLYLALLRQWAPRMNLLSAADLQLVVERHVLDSLAAVRPLAELGPALELVDVGSGAGLPGIPLAIVLAPRRMTLIEPRHRRVSFLRAVARELSWPAIDVQCVRADQWKAPDGSVDALLTRASLPIDALLPLGSRLLRPGGDLLAFRGPHQSEATDVGSAGSLEFEALPPIRYRLPGLPNDLRIDRWRRVPGDCST